MLVRRVLQLHGLSVEDDKDYRRGKMIKNR